MRIIAYTYEADAHCVSCAFRRFCGTLTHHMDEHGLDTRSIDSEGNRVHPVFSTDGHHFTNCGTCRDEL